MVPITTFYVVMCILSSIQSFRSFLPPKFLSSTQSSYQWLILRGNGNNHRELSMKVDASNKDLLKFGNNMDIRVRLPTRDVEIAKEFLQDPTIIIESTYDKSRLTRLSNTLWKIRLADITIPAIDVISPEMEIEFKAVEGNKITMKSMKWALKGTGPIMRDSTFLASFDIKLTGYLELEVSSSALIVAVGGVTFEVQGEKPGVFRNAPPFLLETAINLIQGLVVDFASKQFSGRLLKAFTAFLTLKQKEALAAGGAAGVPAKVTTR